MKGAVLMFDGGARPSSNGEAAIGYTIQVEESSRKEYSEHIGRATNNGVSIPDSWIENRA